MAASRSPGNQASDAVRWWRAYQLAAHDQADELRKLAAAGDDHARWQLASWLSDRAFPSGGPDRAKLGEAIEAIRPLADAGDDVAELWLARWLADCDRLAELRERADDGSYHAARKLARRLADHDMFDELRARAGRGDHHAYYALHELAKRLAEHDLHDQLRELAMTADPERRVVILQAAGEGASGGLDVLRLLADMGEKRGRVWLAHRLAREGLLDELRQRAASGDEYAQQQLDEAPGQS